MGFVDSPLVARRGGRLLLAVLLGCALVLITPASWATCVWRGGMTAGGGNGSVSFAQTGALLVDHRVWFGNIARFPIGSYMAMTEGTMQVSRCGGMGELGRVRLSLVYFPPVGATTLATGYRLPTDNPSLSMDVEFAQGTPYPGGAMLLGTSSGVLNSSGVVNPGGTNNVFSVPTRVSLVKTANFTDTRLHEATSVACGRNEASGTGLVCGNYAMGTFRYVSADNPSHMAAYQDEARLPLVDSRGYVGIPNCVVRKTLPGEETLGSEWDRPVSLKPVNASNFSGVGAIDQATSSSDVVLHCWGLSSTTPELTFSTPFAAAGASGVGMPRADSDIGIQLLLGNNPVRFDVGIPVMLNMRPVFSGFGQTSVRPQQGGYCVANCSANMSGPEWVNAEALEDNLIRVAVSFKYYQTTNRRPGPGHFKVPFTVTVNVP